MMKNYFKSGIILTFLFLIGGCATDSQKIDDLERKINVLENRICSIQKEDNSEKIESLEIKIENLEKKLLLEEKTTAPVTQSAEPKASSSEESPSTLDIQKTLKNAGFYTAEVDGKFGQKTKEAIELFQAANNLKVDGKVGPVTWEQLRKFLTEETTAAAPQETQTGN